MALAVRVAPASHEFAALFEHELALLRALVVWLGSVHLGRCGIAAHLRGVHFGGRVGLGVFVGDGYLRGHLQLGVFLAIGHLRGHHATGSR